MRLFSIYLVLTLTAPFNAYASKCAAPLSPEPKIRYIFALYENLSEDQRNACVMLVREAATKENVELTYWEDTLIGFLELTKQSADALANAKKCFEEFRPEGTMHAL